MFRTSDPLHLVGPNIGGTLGYIGLWWGNPLHARRIQRDMVGGGGSITVAEYCRTQVRLCTGRDESGWWGAYINEVGKRRVLCTQVHETLHIF